MYLYKFQMKAVDHELRAYTFLIPQMQSLRKASNLKPMAFARCFYASAQQELIVLENLKSRDFQVVPKKPQREFLQYYINKLFNPIHKKMLAW